MTVVPFLGGLVGAGLGAAALVAIRRPGAEWAGHGLAMAGFGLGLALGVVPTLAFLALEVAVKHQNWAIGPGIMVAAYAAACVATAVRASRAAAAVSALGLVGGAAALAVAALILFGASLLFIEAIKALVRLVFNRTKCAVTGGHSGKNCTRSGR